jgi:peptide/nickel transport system substrate-binding protein
VTSFKTGIAAAVAVTAGLAAAAPADAETFRYAFQGDAQSLDPHALNETFTIGFHSNIYEGLIRRDTELNIEPALATDWELLSPTHWRFYLREGVTFHNGNTFNADDVIFTFKRIQMDGSDMGGKIAPNTEIVKVDDYTVDFITAQPNPILHYEWQDVFIMDKEWAEANDAVQPTDVTTDADNYAAFNANGTGPFKVESRETDVETVLVRNEDWWDTPQHNLDRVVFTPISQDSTRVAALLSGEVDMAYPIPVQDLRRVDSNPQTETLTGPELRTIFLGMDQMRDELLYSNVTGKNPFKDVRVREAIYRAIDIQAIKQKIMRGQADPSALMISPFLFKLSDQFDRPGYDPEKSRQLLADAGYPDGFQVGMDCPNNRYVNDESICQAVVAMLAKVGVDVDLNAQPKAQYFGKVLGYDTSFYLLGWTPSSLDSYNIYANLIMCLDRDQTPIQAKFNLGGYCNPKIDALAEKILVETDEAKRNELIAEGFRTLEQDWGYVPLHQQYLAWGSSTDVEVKQSPDNKMLLYYVNVK